MFDDVKRILNMLKCVRTGKRLCQTCDGVGRPRLQTPKGLFGGRPPCSKCLGTGIVDG